MARKFVNPKKRIVGKNADGTIFINPVASAKSAEEDFIQFSPADLSFLLQNTSILLDIQTGKSKNNIDYIRLFRGQGFGENGKRYEEGLELEVLEKLLNKVKLSTDLIKVYLMMVSASPDQFLNNTILTQLVEEYESEILNITALEQFNFEEFDKKVAADLNLHLSNPKLQVKGLERVFQNTILKKYHWSTETAIAESKVGFTRRELIDNNLFRGTTSFSKPLESREDVFSVSFDEEVGFSSLKISNLNSNADAWFAWTGGAKQSVKHAYNKFLLKLFEARALQADGKFSFDERRIGFLRTKEIKNYLNSIEKSGYETIKGSVDTAGKVEYKLSVKDYVAKKILDDFRYAAWKNLVKEINKLTDEEAANAKIDDVNKRMFEEGEGAAKNSDVFDKDPDAPGDDELTEDQIKERQKFLKQCALMTRLDIFAIEHVRSVVARAKKENKGKPSTNYNRRRYYMVRDGNHEQHGTITKLLLPQAKNIAEFLEMEPSTHSYLLPKLRFFKIQQKGEVLTESEFKFRNFTSPDRASKLITPDLYDKGGDFGVKEFSISFEGTTPATAKNDVKASLSMYFQSFDDFINKQPENDCPFVDMLLMPKPEEEGQDKKGSGRESRFQFQPDYYRVRVDMGWIIPEGNHGDLSQVIGEDRYKQLKDALLKTNKSFYLNMIDHSIDFRDDGSVQIDVEYRAYIEATTKGTILDALSTKESRAALTKARSDYEKILEKDQCSVKELSKIKRQLLQIESLFRKFSYQSIMKRLISNNMLFHKKLDSSQAKLYQKSGFFTEKVKFHNEKGAPATSTNLSEATEGLTFSFGNDSFDESLENSKDFLNLNYFYLGDLLYVILDCLYQDDGRKYIEGYENFKLILGSLQYEDLFDPKTRLKVVNIGSIPISAELFFEWFTQNVVKPQRSSYPVMYFIRDLCHYLVGEILSENCFKTTLDKKIQFHTTNFVGIGDKLSKLLTDTDPVIDLNDQYSNGTLPLESDRAKKVSIKEYVNYIMIYVDTPRLSIKAGQKEGDKDKDGDIGIYHYQIGKPRGLLKKLKFSKTDAKYLREARYFRNGYDGLMQLANVYNVNLEMIGNTLYYPGMEVYINPLGFMGAKTKEFDPTEGAPNRSVANRLGFGGYHLVTNVKSSISPGKFTTQVTALYHYSGDGDVSSINLGEASEIRDLDDKKEVDKRTKDQKRACEADYNKIVNIALDIDNNKLETYPGIDEYVYGNVTTTGAERVKTTQPPVGVTYAPVVSEVVNNAAETNVIPTMEDIINKYTNTETKKKSAYTETEPLTDRRYYDEGGKRYYEDDPNNPVDL